MCAQEAICVPRFLQFFWNTLYEGWFLWKDFPRLMNEDRFDSGRFHFLLSFWTLPLPVSQTKSKGSEYE